MDCGTMATSRMQRNTTIDSPHYAWYQRIAAENPLLTMADMRRQAHDMLQQNYALLSRVQRPLQDEGIFMSNSELISRLLRMVIYGKIDLFTTVIEKPTVVTRVNT